MPHIPEGTLHAYLDGQLRGRERAELEEHLAGCAECRERLDEAERMIGDASSVMAELEPSAVQPPPWHEIEERAAARTGARPRRPRLRPSLAWAATIVLAFGVGWLSHEYWPEWTGSRESAAGTTSSRAIAEPAAARESEAAQESEETATETEPPAEAPSITVDERPKPEGGAGADAEGRQSEPQAEAPSPADAQAQTIEQATRGRVQARRDQARGVAPLERGEAAAETGADALAPSAAAPARQNAVSGEAKAADSFFVVQPDEASTWLGIRLRTLPALELQRVEVGPGATVEGGLAGLPAVRLTYRDAAGHEITLIQQLLAPGGSRLGDFAGPAFYLDPDDRNAYRWFDTDGRLLILVGDVSGDSLRALADRVH